MLIENVVFNFYEVGEKGIADIKNECLSHFASRLKECLTSSNERIRRFWVDRGLLEAASNAPFKGSIANYKIFQDLYGSKIKYNTKSIVFEETITNNPESIWNVEQYCMDMYNLEYVEETERCSGYFRFRPSNNVALHDTCECSVSPDRDEAQEALRNFYSAFGVGEFPFLSVIIIRLGNKDHYFYTIHR